ncbi:nuclease [Zygosaccharomyces mellis]|uniref:Endonuclease n=1 Tax=Zygosaccharomyces mellis TaxID=42258 RepID=A0A4C2EA45_9SACH|nr:nuclease [Zygosaccharomyces mellis]
MSSRSLYSGLAGVGIGSGIASYFWSKSNSSSNTKVTVPPPIVGGSDTPSGKLTPIGSNLNPAAFFQYGFPGPVHDLENRDEFISCYNRQTRNPYWVVEHITPESLATRNSDRKNSVFKEDEFIPDIFRGRLRDYFRSGYDRGHQAPAANAKFSQKAMDETFYLTNMCPQVGDGFNRDYWAHFEYFCRQLTEKFNSVRIVTGPLYLPKQDPLDGKSRVTYEVIGNPPSIAVPTHFFKLIVGEKPVKSPNSDNISVAAFVLPNTAIPNETKLTEFEVPVDALERSSGLKFFQRVPSDKKKALCKEVECKITVREFQKALPKPKQQSLLPPP